MLDWGGEVTEQIIHIHFPQTYQSFCNRGVRGSMGGEGGREGDWECGGCHNRNYAFRSICNRCKQPRLLVDIKTPADSKWFPRIGDWICPGCSNNNYASREMCKKCGQPKNEATMPALAMPEASLPTYANYFARMQGVQGLRMNYEMMGSVLQQSLPPYSNWPYSGIANKQGANQPIEVPKGWRNGDWLCTCGFHNYSSRTECKKCNAPLPSIPSMTKSTTSDLFPTLGTKRLASEEFINDLDNKRLNAGIFNNNFFDNSHHSYQGFEQFPGSTSNDISGNQFIYSGGDASKMTNVHMHLHSPHNKMMPALIGKGAKQWRDGDWMCTNCNNHNFASRSSCNRCKTERETSTSRPIHVA